MNDPGLSSPVVRLDHVTKTFNGTIPGTTAVREVSFETRPGEMVLLLGPSGSGKTTLLTLIAGLARPTTGTVFLFGKRIEDFPAAVLQRTRAERIGFIFQTFLLIDSLTAAENIEMVLRFTGKRKAERSRKTRELLRELGIEDLADRFPRTMSQGEKQRVAIARAAANDAALIIADEPTGSLETKQGFDIIRLLHRQAKARNAAVIVASHDLRLKEFADRTLGLQDGTLTRV
jgi:putative ABC transport system ATP-binding protein